MNSIKLDPSARNARAEKTVDEDVRYTRQIARRQELCRHLTLAGPRPVYEAITAVARGEDLDQVLEDFGRIPVSVYRGVGASEFNGGPRWTR
jgi:hypothetical protein